MVDFLCGFLNTQTGADDGLHVCLRGAGFLPCDFTAKGMEETGVCEGGEPVCRWFEFLADGGGENGFLAGQGG